MKSSRILSCPPSRRLKHELDEGSRPRHFVFGYGSLICPKSRAITAPTIDPFAQPVLVHNVERTWTARVKSGMTAMGVRFREGACCTGVLLEVSEDELAQFDNREKAYDRVQIHLDNVEQIPFLPEEVNDDNHAVFEAKDNGDDDCNVFVWIYVQKRPIPPDATFPIAQSYVDILLRGCLSISEEFARSFIDTTQGWHDEDSDDDMWVDDRKNPIYIRSDSEYSSRMAKRLDELLRDHQPDAFAQRRKYRRTSTDTRMVFRTN